MISPEQWVRKRARLDAAQNVLVAFLSLAGGLLVLGITFFTAYALVWFCVNYGASALCQLLASRSLHLTHFQILAACSIFLLLLFIGNARTDRERLTDYKLDNPAPPGISLQSGVDGSLVTLLANPGASAKIIADLLYSGPRLVVASMRALQGAGRSLALDAAGCGRALEVLIRHSNRVPCEVLAQHLGGHNVVEVFSQLQRIDGVIYLTVDPPAFTLSEEMRLSLGDVSSGHSSGG